MYENTPRWRSISTAPRACSVRSRALSRAARSGCSASPSSRGSRLEDGARLAGVLHPATHVHCLTQLALLDIEEGAVSESASRVDRSLQLIDRYALGERPTMALAYAAAALSHAREGRTADARTASKHGLWLLEKLTDVGPTLIADAALSIARATLLLGDVNTTRMLVRECHRILARYPDAGVLPERLREVERMTDASTVPVGLAATPLTPAEMRVLRYLPTHLSFEAIAEELIVSRNTVKTQAIAGVSKARRELPSRGGRAGTGARPPGRMTQATTPGTAAAAETSTVPPRAGLVLGALILVAAVANLNLAVANVALPDIGIAFDSSQTTLDLVAVGYSLGLAASVLYLGALGDRYGRKMMLVLGISLSIPASIAAAYAPSDGFLIFARIVGGISAGMAFPTTLALITALWAGRRARKQSPCGPRSAVDCRHSVPSWPAACSRSSGGDPCSSSPFHSPPSHSCWRSCSCPSHVNETSDPVDNLGGIMSAILVGALIMSSTSPPSRTREPLRSGSESSRAAAAIALLHPRSAAPGIPLYDLHVAARRVFWVAAVAGIIVFGSLLAAMFIGQQFLQNVLGYSTLQAGAPSSPPSSYGSRRPQVGEAHRGTGRAFTLLLGYVFVFFGFLTMLPCGTRARPTGRSGSRTRSSASGSGSPARRRRTRSRVRSP